MKLKYTFESVDMGEDIILVPVGESANAVQGVLKVNRDAKEIIDILKENVTEEEIVRKLTEKYENELTEIKAYIHKTLDVLQNAGLIAR